MALILIGIFSILVSIQFFTTSASNEIGIIFIVLGIILIIIGAQRENEKKQDTQSQQNNIYTTQTTIDDALSSLKTGDFYTYTKKTEQLKFTKEQRLELSRKLLISHYMQLAEDLIAEAEEEDKKMFQSKFDLLRASIAELIAKKERLHGTVFLTEDIETNATAKYINQQLGKEAFAITFYFLLHFDEELKLFSQDEVVEAILYALEQPDLDDEQIIHTILERLEDKE